MRENGHGDILSGCVSEEANSAVSLSFPASSMPMSVCLLAFTKQRFLEIAL